MLFHHFLKAWIIGIAIAAPVGPVSIMFIKNTLEHGMKVAISIGIGTALIDALYALIGVMGLTLVAHVVNNDIYTIKIFGGIFLLYLGIKELRHSTTISANISEVMKKRYHKFFFQSMILTLLNPMTILLFLGIFAGISSDKFAMSQIFMMPFGVFMGALSWWLLLGKVITYTKKFLSHAWINTIRLSSALVLLGFGIWAIASVLV